jgi:hypothetical protein
MGTIVVLKFKYRGVMDFKKLYNSGKNFFLDRGLEFRETKYKDKGNEFEGVWSIEHKVDMYSKVTYDIEFKAIDMSPTQDGKYNGKIVVTTKADLEEHYKDENVAGNKNIFHDTKGLSVLHKLYKKVTYRDIHDRIEDDAVLTAVNFQEMLKSICEMEAK